MPGPQAQAGGQHRCPQQRWPLPLHRAVRSSASSTTAWVSRVGSTVGGAPGPYTTYSGTPTALCSSRNEVICGSTLV
ncbi:hypothetical protein G6F62_015355 [Rhizopus arrhizus]|nr:hypothetical protein G6F62_015355 [Rhizopus arrhizus]